jgi:uncharacterized protein (TIGR02284 family)
MSSDPKTGIVDLLNALLAHDYDEIASFEAAIARLENDDAYDTTQLRRFIEDHRRHVARLTLLVYTFGGKPVRGGDLKKVVCTGRVALGGLLGHTAILEAVQKNEDEIRGAYLDAISGHLSGAVRAVLEEHLRDELRHTAWLENRLGDPVVSPLSLRAG